MSPSYLEDTIRDLKEFPASLYIRLEPGIDIRVRCGEVIVTLSAEQVMGLLKMAQRMCRPG